jgi:hypothetical protein
MECAVDVSTTLGVAVREVKLLGPGLKRTLNAAERTAGPRRSRPTRRPRPPRASVVCRSCRTCEGPFSAIRHFAGAFPVRGGGGLKAVSAGRLPQRYDVRVPRLRADGLGGRDGARRCPGGPGTGLPARQKGHGTPLRTARFSEGHSSGYARGAGARRSSSGLVPRFLAGRRWTNSAQCPALRSAPCKGTRPAAATVTRCPCSLC